VEQNIPIKIKGVGLHSTIYTQLMTFEDKFNPPKAKKKDQEVGYLKQHLDEIKERKRKQNSFYSDLETSLQPLLKLKQGSGSLDNFTFDSDEDMDMDQIEQLIRPQQTLQPVSGATEVMKQRTSTTNQAFSPIQKPVSISSSFKQRPEPSSIENHSLDASAFATP
jgi:hypothetical protein